MIAALKDPCELRVVSDGDVRDKVAGRLPRPNKGPHKSPVPVADLAPGVDFGLRPIDMLLELGAATTPPLPDHLRLSARWGLLRYGWALAAPTSASTPLHLSSYAMKVRYHRKTLQSEDLGVGLACWVTNELLAARHPGAAILRADGEQALHEQSLAVPGGTILSLATTGKMPDYFYVAYDLSSATILEVVILECKGTHTDDHVFTQLADAMHQVEAVTVGGATVGALAMGAMLNDQRIRVYAIDPEGSAFAGEAAARGSQRHELDVAVAEEGRLDVADPAAFRRRLLDVGAAQMLNWAGFSEAALARLGQAAPDRTGGGPEEVRENEAGEFVGLSCRLPVTQEDGYEVFFGLDRRIASALSSDDDQAELEAFASVREQVDGARGQLPPGFPDDPPGRPRRTGTRHLALDDPDDQSTARAATPEGLYLEVRSIGAAA